MAEPPGPRRTGLVLSGGGMRGAYAVGVLAGVAQVLREAGRGVPALHAIAGSSVGAINAAYLAANAHRESLNLAGLEKFWTSLELGRYVKVQGAAFLKQLLVGVRSPLPDDVHLGRSLLDARALEELVNAAIDWDALHENIRSGVVGGLFVTALDVAVGKTTVFREVGPGFSFRASQDPRRQSVSERITASHVLASVAIPLLFPARNIGGRFYCDGGVRLNTPLAPVIRTGADRILLVLTRRLSPPSPETEAETLRQYPSVPFLLGKLLNALLLDAVEYDLQVLERINKMVALSRGMLGAAPEEFARVMTQARGAPYRIVEPLVIAPSLDIGELAADYLREHHTDLKLDYWLRRLLLRRGVGRSADWAPYILLDGGFASVLIELGRADALRRREDILAFFQ